MIKYAVAAVVAILIYYYGKSQGWWSAPASVVCTGCNSDGSSSYYVDNSGNFTTSGGTPSDSCKNPCPQPAPVAAQLSPGAANLSVPGGLVQKPAPTHF
jgi:hypothetical protein